MVQTGTTLREPAQFRSLLVPIDLSPGSDRVVGRVSLLTLADDVRVTLLHVVSLGLPARDQSNAERDASKALADEARYLRKLLPKNAKIEPLVKFGAASKEIGSCATQTKAELIVMGRGGGRPLTDVFLGSTAERVIRQAKLPVLVVRRPPRAAYSRPALALDVDEAAHEVIRLMFRMLPSPRPPIAVIHAFDAGYRRRAYSSLSDDEAEDLRHALRLEATRQLGRLLTKALAKLNIPPPDAPTFKTYVRYGSPGIVVERVTRTTDTDLLVLGTRGYSGASYVFLGSVAGALLRGARCDVLIVPPASSRE